MSAALRSGSALKNILNQQVKFAEDHDVLNEENLKKINDALKASENLDQLMSAHTANTKAKNTASLQSSQIVSPIKRTSNGSILNSPTSFVKYFEPMEHLCSSDEDECTFHPKVNANASYLSTRVEHRTDQNETIHESLYRHAATKMAKERDNLEAEQFEFNKKAASSKIDQKSVRIIFEKLQRALKSLIKNNENSEKPGFVTFEELGTILYQVGLFTNLEFKPQEKREGESSLSINQAKVKPERLAQEIIYHEMLWKIMSLVSKEENLIRSDILFRYLMILVDEKTPLADSTFILLQIIDTTLESCGMPREEDGSLYSKIRGSKGLWPMEKVVTEFRKLFDDKTSFMNFYALTDMIIDKKGEEIRKYNHQHHPEINKKSKKLDNRYFNETLVKKIGLGEKDESKQKDLKDRKLRLYYYGQYLANKKETKVEAKIQEELSPCTFKPATISYKKEKGRLNRTLETTMLSSSGKAYFSQALDSCGAQRSMMLYEVAKHYKEKLQQKTYANKKKEEITTMSYCTFKPRLNHTFEHFPARGQDFYQGVPNGFRKVVERLHKGDVQKQKKKEEQEKVPRGENYDKNRMADFNPPTLLSRPKVKRQEVLVYVDVSIGHGKTGRIGIHKGDNARTLAHHFARTYSLNANMQDSLETLLQSYIDSYFAQANENNVEANKNLNQRFEHEAEDDEDEDDDDDDDEDDEEEEERLEEVGEDEEEEREDK